MKDFLRKAFGVYIMILAIVIPVLFYGLVFVIQSLVDVLAGFIVGSLLLVSAVGLFCMGIECLKDKN